MVRPSTSFAAVPRVAFTVTARRVEKVVADALG
jgi:hypothetical protein